jgi:transposase
LNDGKKQREISEFIGCSLKTVAYWCVHGDPNNIESLEDRRKRGRVNVMGALRYSDKKRLCFLIKKGDSVTFYEQIKIFYNALIQEWIEGGNKAEDFKENAAQIIIILDNASFHKKQDIIEQISAEFPKIKLEYLPPYSPDYNLIELVWHSAKEYIAHREFENQEQLEKIVNQLLNEGGLIIKWSRKLKNKGNAINAT